jgi:hypothetical protein
VAQTEAQKRYYKTPKGRAAKKAGDARHYAKNGDKIREHVLDSYHALSDEEKLDRSRRGKEQRGDLVVIDRKAYYDKLKREVIEGYGGRCECCGNDHLPHLTLDHVNGGGNQERKVKSSRTLYTRLRREGFPRGEYRVLCFNCNFGAHLNGGECGCGLTVTRPTAVLREVI